MKLAVWERLPDSELDSVPCGVNSALVMSGQGSGVAVPAVLQEKDKLEMVSHREARGPRTESELLSSSSSELRI